jgi:N-acetylglucosaminyldiphosphoundecaprenol N-acetyl-beta-D-mannosaminyltransferase
MPKISLLGIPIDSVTMGEALEKIERLIEARKPSLVTTPNVDVLVQLQSDAEFRRVYEKAALVVPDGVPLLWAGNFLGTPFKEKVSGSDLFIEFCPLAAKKCYKIYLIGAMPGVAAKAAEILRARHPGLQIVGTYSPPFGFEKDEAECARIVEQVREAKPDVLFIGLGSPKQEKWSGRFMEKHGVPVSIGVGISFDYVAGTVKRAPRWMQKAGLEWSFRLCMEPKRLWKRYLVNDPKFFWWIAKQKCGKKISPNAATKN